MTDNGTATGVELDGDQFPREGPGSFNAGMRGKKGSQYEGGHRVPFLIRYPGGNIAGGRDINALTSYVDFMPTLLDLCGVEVPGRPQLPRPEPRAAAARRRGLGLGRPRHRLRHPARWPIR